MNRKAHLLAATCLGLALASEVDAQPSAGAGERAVEEVVVTATRREERLQDVPLAVSAISGDQLAATGFKDLTNIQYTFTGVQFGTTPNDAGFRLRGVGSAGGFASASEQPVGLVVDGVVIPFGNPVSSLGDVERIEVLKGPQGTQFGKNASSGVVSITTRRPRLGTFDGNVFASYASLDEYDIHGGVNLPLGEAAALDVYLFARGHDGFLKNVVVNEDWGGSKTRGARAKLLWQATEDLSVHLVGDYARNTTTGPGQLWSLNTLATTDAAFNPPFANVAALGVTPSYKNRLSVEDYGGGGGQDNFGGSLQVDWALSDFTLTSVSAYRELNLDGGIYSIDAAPFYRFKGQNGKGQSYFKSQEFRVTSPAGERLQYVAGLYTSRLASGRGEGGGAQLRPALPFAPIAISISNGIGGSKTTTRSTAGFVDGSFALNEQFKLLAGLRYTEDRVKAETYSRFDPSIAGQVLPYTPKPYMAAKTSKGDWSGRFGLEYKPTDDMMFYGTVARGYLGPTVTFSILTGTQSNVAPQTVRDITIGAKTQWFDRRLTLNGNVFSDKYKDLQTSVFNGLEFVTENAGGFKSEGAELEATLRVDSNWRLNGGVTYANAKFTDYITACPTAITVAGPAAVAARCNAPGSLPATPLFQAKGEALPGAPKTTFNIGANYFREVGTDYAVDAAVSLYYRSSTQNSVGDPNTRIDGYSIVNLSAGFGAVDEGWRAGVFVRNLTDEFYQNAVLNLPFSAGSYVNWNNREARRTVGVSLEARF